MTDKKPKLLIVEDDPGIQSQLRWHFEDYEIIQATNRKAAIDAIRLHEPAVVLQDLGLPPDADGVEEGLKTVQETLALAPHTKIIVVTGNGDTDNAVKAVGMGACDFYYKPIDTDTLDLIVQRAFLVHDLETQNRVLREQKANAPLAGMIASSAKMMQVCRMIEKVSPTMATVLILGESGTGKEVAAKAIHTVSPRNDHRFVAINCAAIPDTLMESELFGYEKGAFTGAAKQTPGKIEVANGGTLFLDELGDMPLPLQAKLLRFLQERVIERLGGRAEIPVDVRVVCATNKNLEEMVREGTFREDLYYRISEMVIDLPPLREREGDKQVLARHLLRKMADEQQRDISGFTDDACNAIETYSWPGNVREMENKIKRAIIMSEGKQVTHDDLGLSTQEHTLVNLRQVRQEAEKNAIINALALTDNNISASAKQLGVTRPTLYDLMKKYHIQGAG
jgi:two-component system NtrC family response regulator